MEQEEQFLLRVLDGDVADRIRALMSQKDGFPVENLYLNFVDASEGHLVIGPDKFPVSLTNLPTVVEVGRTMDDENIVKVGDIGQMLLVRPQGKQVAPNDKDGPSTSGQGPTESVHGLTPPMANAREKRFRPWPKLQSETVRKVEAEILTVIGGGAPENMKYHDYDEAFDSKSKAWKVVPRT